MLCLLNETGWRCAPHPPLQLAPGAESAQAGHQWWLGRWGWPCAWPGQTTSCWTAHVVSNAQWVTTHPAAVVTESPPWCSVTECGLSPLPPHPSTKLCLTHSHVGCKWVPASKLQVHERYMGLNIYGEGFWPQNRPSFWKENQAPLRSECGEALTQCPGQQEAASPELCLLLWLGHEMATKAQPLSKTHAVPFLQKSLGCWGLKETLYWVHNPPLPTLARWPNFLGPWHPSSEMVLIMGSQAVVGFIRDVCDTPTWSSGLIRALRLTLPWGITYQHTYL